MNEYIKNVISGSIQTKKKLLEDDFIKKIESAAQIVLNAYKNDNKVIFAGNGGSAADSQHLAAEFVSRFEFDRPGLPSLSLSTDTSMITAISNDYGYKNLFSRQLEAQAKEGDVFIGITTSGKSENILNAFESCVKLGIKSIALVGINGVDSTISSQIDQIVDVPSNKTARIQECHITIGHIICGIVEKDIFG
jgi:D-sedoheptulose 7-phosphate isomerase